MSTVMGDREQRVMDVLEHTHNPLTVKQLERRAGLNFAEVYLAIVELRKAGRIAEHRSPAIEDPGTEGTK